MGFSEVLSRTPPGFLAPPLESFGFTLQTVVGAGPLAVVCLGNPKDESSPAGVDWGNPKTDKSWKRLCEEMAHTAALHLGAEIVGIWLRAESRVAWAEDSDPVCLEPNRYPEILALINLAVEQECLQREGSPGAVSNMMHRL